MNYLALTIRKPQFDTAIIPAHYTFLQLLRHGILEQASPFTDGSDSAYVIRAESLDGANRIAEQDPLHIERCSNVTVPEWGAI